MKRLLAMTIVLPVFLAGCALFRPPAAPPKSSLEQVKQQIRLTGKATLMAGVAKVDITPPVGTPLAGYSKRHGKPSEGIRDPLYVRALALSDKEDLLVLVSADLLVFPPPMAEEILAKISSQLKIPRQAIVLTTTHTHSGAGAIAPGFLYEIVFGPYRQEVMEGIVARLTWAAQQAVQHRQPARWGTGFRETFLEGWTENRMNRSGLTDPSLSVLLLESMEGRPLAVLVNAAAHPTLLDSQDMRFSADFPGTLTRLLETAYPGSVCFFFNGTAGDLRPRDSVGNTPEERVNRFGQILAEGTTGLVNQMVLQAGADLAAWGWQVSLPPVQMMLGPIPLHPAIGRMMRPESVTLNLMAMDGTLFVPLPAEMTAELGLTLKRKLSAHGLQPFLLGYANGYLGYAVTPAQYETKAYEASMTWYGPTLGTSLSDEIDLLATLYSSKETISDKR